MREHISILIYFDLVQEDLIVRIMEDRRENVEKWSKLQHVNQGVIHRLVIHGRLSVSISHTQSFHDIKIKDWESGDWEEYGQTWSKKEGQIDNVQDVGILPMDIEFRALMDVLIVMYGLCIGFERSGIYGASSFVPTSPE